MPLILGPSGLVISESAPVMVVSVLRYGLNKTCVQNRVCWSSIRWFIYLGKVNFEDVCELLQVWRVVYRSFYYMLQVGA